MPTMGEDCNSRSASSIASGKLPESPANHTAHQEDRLALSSYLFYLGTSRALGY